ncbi:hypothetical protein H9L21_06935 [Aeromicrobium senzhongii]|uniref:Uncharacterized protein n=1 Tax=Aeromicrobium senzhongii TaxID=2663859 RepID=A0ABX6SW65_9ACTN|nr:DUF6069 family protein [Aeromicrobium senzhongii]MTB87301.1 hypothetical protein [Aeromicrobium senzhongii]QNL95633.1 hypothetical protein H9L21_06935 [Aeromicrobium senzhongii]
MSALTAGRPRLGRVAVMGVLATVAAAVVTTTLGALAKRAGVEFEIPAGGDAIPTGAFATVTSFFSLIGVGVALAAGRWSDRPAQRFVAITVPLAVASLVPPFVVGASAETSLVLVVLHLAAAAVVIPTLARTLRVSSVSPRAAASRR